MNKRRVLLNAVALLVIASGGGYLRAQSTFRIACCHSWWHTCCGEFCNATIFGCNAGNNPK